MQVRHQRRIALSGPGGLTEGAAFPYLTAMGGQWLRVAHRGASGSAPEHTRTAFERALDFGVDMIELDVQLSRDHELVVIHDLDLARTTTGNGLVRQHDFAALKDLDAGLWFGARFAGQRLLSLEEVIAIVGTRARLNVEVKAPAPDWPVLAPRLIALLRACGRLDSTILSCFEPGALVALRACAADAPLGLLWQRPDFSEAWQWSSQLRAVSLHPHWSLISADLLRAARRRGLQVLTWTVNDVEVMGQLVRLGVDGIISDFPERFRDISERTSA
jgi:glycerophosphoryl diester phosphodiesterase